MANGAYYTGFARSANLLIGVDYAVIYKFCVAKRLPFESIIFSQGLAKR